MRGIHAILWPHAYISRFPIGIGAFDLCHGERDSDCTRYRFIFLFIASRIFFFSYLVLDRVLGNRRPIWNKERIVVRKVGVVLVGYAKHLVKNIADIYLRSGSARKSRGILFFRRRNRASPRKRAATFDRSIYRELDEIWLRVTLTTPSSESVRVDHRTGRMHHLRETAINTYRYCIAISKKLFTERLEQNPHVDLFSRIGRNIARIAARRIIYALVYHRIKRRICASDVLFFSFFSYEWKPIPRATISELTTDPELFLYTARTY